ncbi:MAG: hypothetical protein SWO11_13505 [Thermodesulfobacteriota bacterium]|nr:hypothetical protein [Thermodesulfobacteriota bacterium]
MKSRIFITLSLALMIVLYIVSLGGGVSSQFSTKDKKATEDQLTIGVSPAMRGTLPFSALFGSRTIPGVEIRIDGEVKGITDENGELLAKWIVAGKHNWSAIYEGKEVSQGEFEISAVTDAKIVDRAVRLRGEELRESGKLYALKDDWTFVHTVKNTGTTVIDHYTIELIASSGKGSSMKIELISPPIPGWIWKPFAGDLKSGRRRIEVKFKGDGVEIIDGCSAHPMKNVTLESTISKEGLWPGESITVAFEEPYVNCLDEIYKCMELKLNTEIRQKVVDVDKGIMNMIIKEYKVLFYTFHDIKAQLTLKGFNKKEIASLYLYIDDTMYDTAPWFDYEWL